MRKLHLLWVAVWGFSTAGLCQMSSLQQKAIVLRKMVEKNHYAPRAVNDSFSTAVFKTVMEATDPRRLLFTAADYQQLVSFNTKLDDELQGNGWGFFDKLSLLYKKALTRADSIINKVLQKPFDFSLAESISSTRAKDSFLFATDEAALTNRWSRYLKYLIMDEVYDEVNADSTKKLSFKSALTTLEPKAREKVKKTQLKTLKRTLEHPAGYDAYMNELFLNALATCFDPHTNYFSPQGKEEMQAQLSTEAYFFGIIFDQAENGQIVVDKLTPGGPAWKSGEINKGDELVSLHWEGKEVQDMTGASLDEVFEVLDQSIHDKLLFRFKKADGTMSMVFLRKEKASNDENIVKSFVLKGDKKIGYILLPGFYTEWENETGSSCANDVAKEILKLKRENIDGLILDVRYNGGGSVGEALDMTGIFIEEGPLAAEKERDGKLVTMKDPNRGTIYDGPLVLMVNGQSASASEMLAGSLQDYNRALIVGSNTYGKATMQVMFPMDTMSTRVISGNDKGDVIKITTGKLYRVNGRTAQLIGVKPDIVIPDAFEGLEIGERFEDYPLIADTVKRNNYYKPLPYLPLVELSSRSAARISASADFQSIKKIIADHQRLMKETTVTIPLKTELFEQWMKKRQAESEIMKGESKPSTSFVVENHAADKKLLESDNYAKGVNNDWLKNLSDDIYIQEVYMILTDLINLQKTAPKN